MHKQKIHEVMELRQLEGYLNRQTAAPNADTKSRRSGKSRAPSTRSKRDVLQIKFESYRRRDGVQLSMGDPSSGSRTNHRASKRKSLMPTRAYNEQMNQLVLDAAALQMQDCDRAKLPENANKNIASKNFDPDSQALQIQERSLGNFEKYERQRAAFITYSGVKLNKAPGKHLLNRQDEYRAVREARELRDLADTLQEKYGPYKGWRLGLRQNTSTHLTEQFDIEKFSSRQAQQRSHDSAKQPATNKKPPRFDSQNTSNLDEEQDVVIIDEHTDNIPQSVIEYKELTGSGRISSVFQDNRSRKIEIIRKPARGILEEECLSSEALHQIKAYRA